MLPGPIAQVVNLVCVGCGRTYPNGEVLQQHSALFLHANVFFFIQRCSTEDIQGHIHTRGPWHNLQCTCICLRHLRNRFLSYFFQSCPLEPTPASMHHKNRAGEVLCTKMQFVLYTLLIQPHWDHKDLKICSSHRDKRIGIQGF